MKDKSSQGIALPPSLCLGYNLWCLDCSWMLQSGFIYTSANEFWLLAGFSSMWLLICQQTRLRFFTALWSEGFKRARLELQDLLRSRVFRIHTMSHLPHSIGQGKSQGPVLIQGDGKIDFASWWKEQQYTIANSLNTRKCSLDAIIATMLLTQSWAPEAPPPS